MTDADERQKLQREATQAHEKAAAALREHRALMTVLRRTLRSLQHQHYRGGASL